MKIFEKIKNYFKPKDDYCMFYILSLLRNERHTFIHKNLSIYDQFELFQSVNGYKEEETLKELKASGLKFSNLHDANSLRYGVLANFLTKYKMLEFQVEHEIPYICMIEDDVIINNKFVDFIYHQALHSFKKDPKLNIIRLGTWGEGYITSLPSARRILKLIRHKGICENIDNQLRKYCGPEKNISKRCFDVIYGLASKPNSGDCLNTDFIDLSKIDPFNLKNADVKNYCKYHDKKLMYFSQNGTDKYLQDHLFKGKEECFFVDIGATNGINSNNTLTLERCFDWKGLLIEPSLEFENLFTHRSNRGFNRVRSQFLSHSSGDSINFGHCKKSCFASESKRVYGTSEDFHVYNLTSVTFTDLFLQDYKPDKVIDFLSISSNGTELDILQGINFSLLNIRSILVKSDLEDQISELLQKKNFIKIKKISRYILFVNYDSFGYFDIDNYDFPNWENSW